MRAFTAQQRALAAASSIKPILLVVLTTYADRALGTVDTVYYLADRPVMYDYGNTGTVRQFEPLVLSVSDLTQSIPHVPGTTPAGLEAELRITLSNLPYRGGVPFVRELRAHNLEFATLELATVYGPLDTETGWYDLRAYTGDEHIVELRGEVEMAEGIDAESFQLRVVTPEVTVPWIRADDATITDPKDLGARLPIVYGAAKRVPCVNWQVGWTTTLAVPLISDASTGGALHVSDPTGFPLTAFSVQVGGERVSVAARAASTDDVIVTGRAQESTTLAYHVAGAEVVELVDQTVIAVAGSATSSVTQLSVRNPYNQQLFSPRSLPVASLADTVTVPGATVTTVTLTRADLTALLDDCSVSAQVEQQPEFTTAGGSVLTEIASPNVASFPTTGNPGFSVSSWLTQFNGSASSPSWTAATPEVFGKPTAGLTVTAFPTAAAQVLNVELKATLTFDLISWTTTGTYGVMIWPANSAFGWTSGTVCLIGYVSGGSAGSVEIRTGKIAWAGYPPINNGFQLRVMPFTSGYTTGPHPLPQNHLGLGSIEFIFEYADQTQTSRIVDTKIVAASVGYGLDFYADVDGPAVPATYVAGYGFEESSSWNVSGCTVAADTTNKTEGAQSIKVSITETEIETLDSGAGSWSATRCTATNDTGDKTRGTASMKLVATTTYQSAFVWRQGLTAADWSGKVIAFDVRLTSLATWAASGSLTNTLGVRFGVSSDATYSDHIKEWTFGLNAGLSESWVTICFDPATYSGLYYSAGTLDIANVRGYMFVIQQPTATPALLEMRVDSLRLIPKTAIAQRNATSGTVVLSADALGYQLALRADDREAFGAGSKVYVSDTAGSGTTPPAARRELALDVSLIGDGAFAVQEITATDVGSPTVVDVETVGVSLAAGTNPMTLLGPPVLRIDNLRRRDDSASAYAGAVGDMIEHPADVTRHLLTARCGLADSYADTATLTSWATNAPDVKIGADLRALGETLPELLARIGYEGRANVLRAEGAATSAYKALCAEADYTWPASSGRALTQYQALSEVGRDGREIATRFQFLYDRDPSRGTDLAAYDGLIRANPTVSDVSVSAATLATREQKYGRRDADVGVLLAHRDEASAQDVAGYYVSEAGRDAGTFVLRGCAWWEAADVELGDLLDLAPPWRASAVKVRAIEVTRQFGAGVVDLRAVEVI